MAGIKPLDMAGNYNVGIGWELNRWLQTNHESKINLDPLADDIVS